MGEDRTNIGIAVECIECGQDVCVHQQSVIRGLEARLREVEAGRDECAAGVVQFEAEREKLLSQLRQANGLVGEAEGRAADLEGEVEKWKGRARRGVSTPPPGYDKSFVPQGRLREACEQRDEAEARVERLEAELREAGDTFSELAIYLEPDEGQTHNADACGVDACIFCLAEARARKARDRARGVLESGAETDRR